MVTVYAWYPWEWYHFAFGQVKTPRGGKTAGHATLMYSGQYVSLWTGSRISESFADDVSQYGVLPHSEVTIHGLNEEAIHDWWQEFKDKVRSGVLEYELLGMNCAYTVALALYEGLDRKGFGSWYAWNSMWSPRDAIQYAEAISERNAGR